MAKSLSHDLRFRGLELVRADDRRRTPTVGQLRERPEAIVMSRSPTAVPTEAPGRPVGYMVGPTTTQHSELLRLLFAGIAVKHVGCRNGPVSILGDRTLPGPDDQCRAAGGNLRSSPIPSRVATCLEVFELANPA
jgi:hypothetical protein